MSGSVDIIHYFQVKSPIESVFEAISSARGISKWWSRKTTGYSEFGALLELEFSDDVHWQAQVTEMDPDWMDSRVGFQLSSGPEAVDVKFYHKGWKEANDHYYISSYCWAMYLRIMKRYVEFGEFVEYEQRLNV
jgi:hypothetical protein